MSVRNYAILYGGVRRVSSGASFAGGNALLSTEQHALDGAEHTGQLPIGRLSTTETDTDLRLAPDGTGGVEWAATEGSIVVGTVTPGGSPVQVTTGTRYKAFVGAGWLDRPTAAEHVVGERFLLAIRDGTGHLTGGKISAAICTLDTLEGDYTTGTFFDVLTLANDIRPQGPALSVLDVGDGTYHAVLWLDEFNGTNNILPFVYICDARAETMTSSSSWTRHNVAGDFSGHTQDAANGPMHRLSNGTYMMAGQYYVGAAQTVVVLSSPDITDWSNPTMTEVAAGYNECHIVEVPGESGTIRGHLRNTAQTGHYGTISTDYGASWSAPALLFAAMGYPDWEIFLSGIGASGYRQYPAGVNTVLRQTATGATDTGWGAEVVMDTNGVNQEYFAFLQVTRSTILGFYAYETTLSTVANVWSQVITDSSVFPDTGTVRVSASDLTADYLEPKLLAGTGVTITRLPGVSEVLEIAATAVATTAAESGHWEVVVNPDDATAVLTPDGTDWVHGFVPD